LFFEVLCLRVCCVRVCLSLHTHSPLSLSLSLSLSPRTPTMATTKPIIIDASFPTPDDVKITMELKQVLHAYNLYETEEAQRKRERVLAQFNALIQEWVKQESVEQAVCCVCVRVCVCLCTFSL